MSIKEELEKKQVQKLKDNQDLLDEIDKLDCKVELKGTSAVLIDDQLLIFISHRTYQNLKTGKRGKIEKKIKTYLKK